MKRVLVTRPLASGEELCQLLTECGIEAHHYPLIDILPGRERADLSEALAASDIIIAVSQYAVSFASDALIEQQASWPQDCRYFAVGQKTAQCLSKACGQPVHFPQKSDSEHLVALPEMSDLTGKQITILRGNGGRDVIYDTLVAQGAKVSYKEMYQRIARPTPIQQCLAQWQAMGINTIIITSKQQLMIFMDFFKDSPTNWPTQQTLIVPSDRIAHYAEMLGFTQIIVSGSAHNADLVAALSPNQQDFSNDK
ncbi:uroporphyrinogen-III synthase [Vibrio zhugei]|uniref:Uroporphyrinogen-III synthase n=1 Tax=Vibrio zhugei TaxID=2479546 RepID=A0ABV7CEB2_9VIBR|nr:uroporphyrinogen-III synthase [Vibrio zhugei]